MKLNNSNSDLFIDVSVPIESKPMSRKTYLTNTQPYLKTRPSSALPSQLHKIVKMN